MIADPQEMVPETWRNLIWKALKHAYSFLIRQKRLDSVANLISFEDFKRLNLRVGTVTTAEKIPRTERLYKILVDLGELGERQTVSSLVEHYTPEELIGKKIVFFVNLRSTRFSGETSEGMLLAAEKGENLALLTTDRNVENGARIT